MRSSSDPANDQTFGASYLLDASASYDWNNWQFTVGANNLTNQYPDRNSDCQQFPWHPRPIHSPRRMGSMRAYYYARAR